MTPQITKIEEKIKALQRKMDFLDVSINRRIRDIEASIDLFKVSTKIEFAKIRQLPSMVQYVPFDENKEISGADFNIDEGDEEYRGE